MLSAGPNEVVSNSWKFQVGYLAKSSHNVPNFRDMKYHFQNAISLERATCPGIWKYNLL